MTLDPSRTEVPPKAAAEPVTGIAIRAEGLVKRFGGVVALDGIDLEVPRGTVLGLLGPNGAGKTTVVRILATILRPDGGHASILGLDLARDADAIRSRIGLAGQYAGVDEYLTGRENLVRALALGGPTAGDVLKAVLCAFVIVGVFAPLAVARYRRAIR